MRALASLLCALVGASGCHFAPGPGDVPGPDLRVDPLDPAYLQVGTFNIDWLTADLPGEYTPRNEADLAMISSLIQSMDVDVLALQEIDGPEALTALALPPEWAFAVGTTGWSQNVALLYRQDRVTVSDVREVALPVNDFPSKDPLVADVVVRDGDLAFTLVALHLNPYVDWSEARFRAEQVRDVVAWLTGDGTSEPPGLPVVVAGDLNDTRQGLNASWDALQPLEDLLAFATADTERYTNIPFRSQIDHVALAPGLEARRAGAGTELGVTVVEHDLLSPWSDYDDGVGGEPNVSSHRPLYVDLAVRSLEETR